MAAVLRERQLARDDPEGPEQRRSKATGAPVAPDPPAPPPPAPWPEGALTRATSSPTCERGATLEHEEVSSHVYQRAHVEHQEPMRS
jgi:hypothetical protein